jgi:hypothetical protein
MTLNKQRDEFEKSTPVSGSHQFLTIGRYHRNDSSAERLLFEHLQIKFPNLSKNTLKSTKFTFQVPDKEPFERTFDEMRREARETGTVWNLHPFVYGSDAYFPMTLGISTNGAGLKIKSEYAGHVAEFAGPMRVIAIEDELSDDILWYRREACEASASTSFARCTRYYRAYILVCTSMVEAFMNRPVLLLGHFRKKVDIIEKLHRPLPFEERIELWIHAFCGNGINNLKQSTAWGHFQELREERNKLVHATRPQLGVEIRALERGLNLVREGVGGFMRKLRAMQKLPTTPFIERLESAPLVTFRPKSKNRKEETNS